MLKILRIYRLYPKLVNITGLTSINIKSEVKFKGEITEPFIMKTGLRHSDGLLPFLFNIALDFIMKLQVKEKQQNIKIGTGVNAIKTNCLRFSDDVFANNDLELVAKNMEKVKNQIISLEKNC